LGLGRARLLLLAKHSVVGVLRRLRSADLLRDQQRVWHRASNSFRALSIVSVFYISTRAHGEELIIAPAGMGPRADRAQVMADSGLTREEAVRELELAGGI